MKVRRPTQAGVFYAGDVEALKHQIESCFLHQYGPGKIPKFEADGPRKVVGILSPHAGYMYSGPVAANGYYELAQDGKPDTFVIMGPNHTGYGSALSLVDGGAWRTPFGDVEIDAVTAQEILRETHLVDVDESAHTYEHSVEVQLPFLQYLYGKEFKFVPICFQLQDFDTAKEVGNALIEVLSERNAVIVASSDFTHYEPQDVAEKKDLAALEAVRAMDPRRFFSIVERQHITVCGYGPISTLIIAAKGMLAKDANLLQYKTSGDITGDKSSVVGYASVSFKK